MNVATRWAVLIAAVALYLYGRAPTFDFSEARPKAWVPKKFEGFYSQGAIDLSDELKEEKRKRDLNDHRTGYDDAWDTMGTMYKQQVADTYFALAQSSWYLYWRDYAEYAMESEDISTSVECLNRFFAGDEGVLDGQFIRVHIYNVVESVEPQIYSDQLVKEFRVWRNEALAAAGDL